MVLSAPSSLSEIYSLSCVIVVVSVFSAVGAGWIILSFILFPSLRTFRHQLILGLAISDLLMAINFLSSAAVNIHGPNIGSQSMNGFCSFNGFMIQVFVVQTDYWVLTIAVCTYFILANHSTQSNWVQKHRVVIWVIPWTLSLLWATIGLSTAGYGDIGAWCWFTSDRVRLFVNFIPRWLIIVAILALYLRLYFIIHNAHARFMSFESSAIGSLETEVSTTQITPGQSHNMFPMASDDCEQNRGRIPTNSRIGRASPVLKKISLQMMVYPLVYMCIWTIPTVIRIYQATTGKSAPFAIGTVDKACIVIQGFADAGVYGYNERTGALWRDIMFNGRRKG